MLGVVFDGGATNNWPEGTLNRAGEDAGSLLGSGDPPALLFGWLIKPGLDVQLPRLVEVVPGDRVVVLGHGLPTLSAQQYNAAARWRIEGSEREKRNFFSQALT